MRFSKLRITTLFAMLQLSLTDDKMENVKSALHQTCERIRKYTTVGTYVKRKFPVRETAIEPLVLLFYEIFVLANKKSTIAISLT